MLRPLVGAPGQDVGGLSGAGHIYLGAATGLRYWRTLVQGTDGVPGEARAGARFGESLAIGGHGLSPAEPHTERLYVGTPGLDVGSLTDAGGVVELTMTFAGDGVDIDGVQLTQDTPGVPGTAEAGDEFGAAIIRLAEGTLWIGAPGEDLGETIDAGMAVAVSYSYESIQNLNFGVTQNTDGFAGSAEAGDRFGPTITSFLPYYEDEDEQQYPVLVGVPGEDIGTVRDAGMVNSFAFLSHSSESVEIAAEGELLSQGPTAGQVETGDRFGATLATFDFFYGEDPDHAPEQYRALHVVGAPGEDDGAGGIVRVQYLDNELRSRIWKQETGARERGDGFGTAIVREW